MKLACLFLILWSCVGCTREYWGMYKSAATVGERDARFEHDTSITFGQYAGEPGPVSRRISFNVDGRIEVTNGFPGYHRQVTHTSTIGIDTVRTIVRHALEAQIFSIADTSYSIPDEPILDGGSIYTFELNAGRRSKSIHTDGSDRATRKLITLYNVVDLIAWQHMPDLSRWRWYGRAYGFEDIR